MGEPKAPQLELTEFNKQAKQLKLGLDKEFARLKLDPELMAEMKKFSAKLESDLQKAAKSTAKDGMLDPKAAKKPIEKAGKDCCKIKMKHKDTTGPTSMLPKALQSKKGIVSLNCGPFATKLIFTEVPKKGIKVEGFIGVEIPIK